jgi:hypothetical protein
MIILLGPSDGKTEYSYSAITHAFGKIVVQGVNFQKLTDLIVTEPVSLVIPGMEANPIFYDKAFEYLNDDVGIIYGDYVMRQNGASIVRLNQSYRMCTSCVPLLGSIISPSFFYQIVNSLAEQKSCDVSTHIDPFLDFFGDCCPQHWPEVSFII